MIAALERSFGIDEDIRHVLGVSYFAITTANLKKGIVGRACRVCRVEQEYISKARAPSRGQLEILALDIVDDHRARPSQKSWNDQADPLARTGRRKAEHVLRPIMAKISTIETPEHEAIDT